MKKLLIATLCVSAFALTACDKKAADTTTTTATAVSLTTNNAADIKSDLTAVETLSTTKAKEALDTQSKLMESLQKGDKGALENMMKEMKTFIEGFNKDLAALPLKSTEVDATRNKMKEANDITLQLTETSMTAQPDQTKISELTTKMTEIQKELMTDMQTLKAKAAEAK